MMPTLKSLFLEIEKKYKAKKPFYKTDLRTSPGGDTGTGRHARSFHGDTGSYSGSGSGLPTQGSPGFSKAASEFNLPINTDPENLKRKPVYTEKKKNRKMIKTWLDDEENIKNYDDLSVPPDKNPPVGSPTPGLGVDDGNRAVGKQSIKAKGYRQR